MLTEEKKVGLDLIYENFLRQLRKLPPLDADWRPTDQEEKAELDEETESGEEAIQGEVNIPDPRKLQILKQCKGEFLRSILSSVDSNDLELWIALAKEWDLKAFLKNYFEDNGNCFMILLERDIGFLARATGYKLKIKYFPKHNSFAYSFGRNRYKRLAGKRKELRQEVGYLLKLSLDELLKHS